MGEYNNYIALEKAIDQGQFKQNWRMEIILL